LLRVSGHDELAVAGITTSCTQTLAEISKNRPDLILMDIRIQGDIDGIETVARVRQRFDIPVIYLTGQTDPQTINRAKLTLVSGLLPKPVQSGMHRAHRQDRLELEGIVKSHLAMVPLDGTMESQNASAMLRKSEQRLLALLDGVKDYSILLLDEGGHVATWTTGAEKIKGYSAEEILGTSFARFYTPEDVDRGHPEEVLRIARRDGHFGEEGWRIRKDGSRFRADVMITTLRDEGGRIIGFSKVTRDITEHHRSREERDNLIARLEKALRKKLFYCKKCITGSRPT
jgi:PAS domain S-box-containing protein